MLREMVQPSWCRKGGKDSGDKGEGRVGRKGLNARIDVFTSGTTVELTMTSQFPSSPYHRRMGPFPIQTTQVVASDGRNTKWSSRATESVLSSHHSMPGALFKASKHCCSWKVSSRTPCISSFTTRKCQHNSFPLLKLYVVASVEQVGVWAYRQKKIKIAHKTTAG